MVADEHDTPANSLSVEPVGFGVPWIPQLVPFHTSTNVTVVPALFLENPMAVHALADEHDTPANSLSVAPAGFGVPLIPHLVPFHTSTNVTVLPVLLFQNPTAVHELADEHDTPANSLSVDPAGFGVLWIAQVVPFHPSASVNVVPEPFW